MPAKVIHGHSIEIELGPSCPNPGTKDEDEMFDYLKDISEFGHENPHN